MQFRNVDLSDFEAGNQLSGEFRGQQIDYCIESLANTLVSLLA